MPAAETGAIGAAEAVPLFDHLAGRPALALGVSGGADSLALMLLAARWREALATKPKLLVLTVDHGLRPSSADEAAMVAAVAARLGLPHRTLRWTGPKPEARVEERARDARYRLLAEACSGAGIADLLVAHHQDDQAETVLMRLGKASGLAGLAGMCAARRLGEGITVHRPLLGVAKERLVATVRAAGLTPVMDESNVDDRFARPKLRRLAGSLAEAGVSAEAIAASAVRLAEADAALEYYVDRLAAEAVSFDRYAVARIDRAAFTDAPREIRLRLLRQVIDVVGGGAWPPLRHDRLEALQAAISGGTVRRTLGGALIASTKSEIVLHREAGRRAPLPLVLSRQAEGIWDRRFAYRLGGSGGSFTLGPLGEAGRREIGLKADIAPGAALAALPALRTDGDIVSVPSVGFHRTEAAFTVKCIVGPRLAALPSPEAGRPAG